MSWKDDSHKKCFYNAWLQSNNQRKKLKTEMRNGNITMILDYVPSIFIDHLPMSLVMESLVKDGSCGGFSASVPVVYVNNNTAKTVLFCDNEGKPYPSFTDQEGTHVRIRLKDWLDPDQTFTIKWNQNLTTLMDDGYSNSACLSLITYDTKQIVRRTFARNLGVVDDYDVYIDGVGVPTNRKYKFEISPTSAKRENFGALDLILEIEGEGKYTPYVQPFRAKWRQALIVVLMGGILMYIPLMVYRTFLRSRKVEGKGDKQPLISNQQQPLAGPGADRV
jgi:hypothetical protein